MSQPTDMFTEKGAIFSDCRKYRYRLWRIWDRGKPPVMFLMLNPSTADEVANDPTVERCERYARRWGYGGLYVCNIFAWRATDPEIMKAKSDPVGPDNDRVIVETARLSGKVVCAWGNHGSFMERSDRVLSLLKTNGIKPFCLTVTAANEPGHPLYLRKDLTPVEYVR